MSATELVTRYFESMAALDIDAMARCWHKQISHSDPLFEDLRGATVRDRWAWQSSHCRRFKLQFNLQFVDERKAQVGWRANYLFGTRPVDIVGRTALTLWDGTIVRQVDEFQFSRWSGQAINPLWFALGRIGRMRRWQQSRLRRALPAHRGK